MVDNSSYDSSPSTPLTRTLLVILVFALILTIIVRTFLIGAYRLGGDLPLNSGFAFAFAASGCTVLDLAVAGLATACLA